MKVYVASSWRCERQPAIVAALRAAGHEVYDFKNPAPDTPGFGWNQITNTPPPWSAAETLEILSSPVADRGFDLDMNALKWCDACVMVQPCGRSAALELGWACGTGKITVALLEDGQEPELMLKMADAICVTIESVIDYLGIVAKASAHAEPKFGPNPERYRIASEPHVSEPAAIEALDKFFAGVSQLREALRIPEVVIVAAAYHGTGSTSELACSSVAFGNAYLRPELGSIAFRLYTAPVIDRAKKLQSLSKEEET